jgi:hypothetical protein
VRGQAPQRPVHHFWLSNGIDIGNASQITDANGVAVGSNAIPQSTASTAVDGGADSNRSAAALGVDSIAIASNATVCMAALSMRRRVPALPSAINPRSTPTPAPTQAPSTPMKR